MSEIDSQLRDKIRFRENLIDGVFYPHEVVCGETYRCPRCSEMTLHGEIRPDEGVVYFLCDDRKACLHVACLSILDLKSVTFVQNMLNLIRSLNQDV